MKLIKKIARKILFSKKKELPSPIFQTNPTTSVNSTVEPVVSFEKPKLGGIDLDDKYEKNIKVSEPEKKKPGRPKATGNSAPKKTPIKKVANTPKATKKTI